MIDVNDVRLSIELKNPPDLELVLDMLSWIYSSNYFSMTAFMKAKKVSRRKCATIFELIKKELEGTLDLPSNSRP